MLYYENENGRLYKGDCLDIMDKLIDEGVKVDAIICDPPYGTVKSIANSNKIKHGMKNKTEWDEIIPIQPMFDKCEKLLREGGACVLFGQEPYTSDLIKNQHNNLPFSYRNIWLKDHFANALTAKKAPLNYYEDITVFFRKYDIYNENPLRSYFLEIMNYIGLNLKQINKKIGHRKAEHCFYIKSTQFKLCTKYVYNELIDVFAIHNMDGFMNYEELLKINNKYIQTFNLWEGNKYKSNVFQYKKDYDGFHSTQKPVLLIEDLIKTYTNEGELILDFTSGSSTTAVACENTNRKWICIEKEDKYCEISKNRIMKEV